MTTNPVQSTSFFFFFFNKGCRSTCCVWRYTPHPLTKSTMIRRCLEKITSYCNFTNFRCSFIFGIFGGQFTDSEIKKTPKCKNTLRRDYDSSHQHQTLVNTHILANRPDLVGTVPIWRPKPDVSLDDPKKPIRPDLSRSTPKNTILNLPFACSLCSSVRIQVFFRVFWPFFMYPSVVGSYPNKKSFILGIVLVKKFVLLSFSSKRKKLCINFRPIFLAVNV